ncbi:MAG: hemerythrin domain-containing protein [Candidatus Thiodiazotropha sp.]
MGIKRILSILFSGGRSEKSNTSQNNKHKRLAAPGTRVYFDEDLIDQLKDEHQILLGLYSKISQAYKNKKYKRVSKLLGDFKHEVYSHFLLENIKLYIYLRNTLHHDHHSSKIMRFFQKEINQIGKVVDQFIDHYADVQWTNDEIARFEGDLRNIGNALVTRINREEKFLYPLYLPPDDYAQ